MARSLRCIEPGSFQHIFLGGVELRKIYGDTFDRKRFMKRAARIFDEEGDLSLVFALMPNHFHFVVRAGLNLSKTMQRLLGGHALGFNRRHDRVGPLFRGRFVNVELRSSQQLRIAVLYVALNPLRGRVRRTLERAIADQYCGLGALLGEREDPLVNDSATRLYGETPDEARPEILRRIKWVLEHPKELDEYEAFLSAGNKDEALDSGVKILEGDAQIVFSEAKTAHERPAKLKAAGWSLDTLLRWIAQNSDLSVEEILEVDTRHASAAKALFVFLARSDLDFSAAELASILAVQKAQISRLFYRGRAIARHEDIIVPETLPEELKPAA